VQRKKAANGIPADRLEKGETHTIHGLRVAKTRKSNVRENWGNTEQHKKARRFRE
jgi:hypothetical protein